MFLVKNGGLAKVELSKSGKAMLVSHLLQKQKKNLTFLSRSEENVELVIEQIKELKKHMIIKVKFVIFQVNMYFFYVLFIS